MNETRKQIIELIEPYMDKTLSEWCLILYRWFYTPILTEQRKLWINKDWNYFQLFQFWNMQKIWDFIYWAEFEIIWHYDITAILKYININWYSIELC